MIIPKQNCAHQSTSTTDFGYFAHFCKSKIEITVKLYKKWSFFFSWTILSFWFSMPLVFYTWRLRLEDRRKLPNSQKFLSAQNGKFHLDIT